MIRKELRSIFGWEERHRRLISRIVIVIVLTMLVDVVASVLIWVLERRADGTDVHTVGDAVFFSTTQLLTISSQLKIPLTGGGRVVDVALEVWGVVVVASVGGSFASFFTSGDRG